MKNLIRVTTLSLILMFIRCVNPNTEELPENQETAFILGKTKPNATNTGVKGKMTSVKKEIVDRTGEDRGLIKVYNGKYENIRYEDYVDVVGDNVEFVNCTFIGPSQDQWLHTVSKDNNRFGLVNCYKPGQNVTLTRCTLKPQDPTFDRGWFRTGVQIRNGAKVKIERCDISNTVDAINIDGATGAMNNPQVEILGNFIHDMSFYNNSEDTKNYNDNEKGWTHNDGVQIFKGKGVKIKGNYFYCYLAKMQGKKTTRGSNDTAFATEAGYIDANNSSPSYRNEYMSGITISPRGGYVTELTITKNWFEGGRANIQANSYPGDVHPPHTGNISENLFGYDQYQFKPEKPDSKYVIRYVIGYKFDGLTTNKFDNVSSVPKDKIGKNFYINEKYPNGSGITVSYSKYSGN